MELIDKLKGGLVGFAFGDAMGLGTEFMTHKEVKTYYPDGLRRFDQFIRDAHRSQWKPGQWTHDTNIVIQLLEGIIAHGGFDINDITNNMKVWMSQADIDICPKVRLICNEPDWAEHPIATAHRVWQRHGWKIPTNEAVQRALVTGLGCTESELNECTRKLVLITNDDTRCVSTILILAKMIHSLLHKEQEPDYDELLHICNTVDSRTTYFLKKAHDGDIETLKVDDPESWSWTRKTMAAALWGFWHGKDASDSIFKVVDLGGDSDSNASLTGAMVGIKYGYDALPAEKEKLIGLEKLLDLAERLEKYWNEKK